MDDQELAERQAALAAARRYIGTPYHPGGRKIGVGVDCLTVMAAIYEDAGLIPRIEIPQYSPDWHLHRSDERYMEGLLQYTREIEGPPQLGDIALFKFGRCYSHGVFVVKWPSVIHAYLNSRVVEENVERCPWLKKVGESGPDKGNIRPVKFFSLWPRNNCQPSNGSRVPERAET